MPRITPIVGALATLFGCLPLLTSCSGDSSSNSTTGPQAGAPSGVGGSAGQVSSSGGSGGSVVPGMPGGAGSGGMSVAGAAGAAGEVAVAGAAGAAGSGGQDARAGAAGAAGMPGRDPNDMSVSFFLTSYGVVPDGAQVTEGPEAEGTGDLGGLEGADAHCQMLAEAAGDMGKTWRAYLSTSAEDARDRIGPGPWYTASGDLVAADLEGLHTENAMPGRSGDAAIFGIDESGTEHGRMDHDVITGSNEDGTVAMGQTCQDWTSSSADDTAMVGHLDGAGGNRPGVNAWNSEHENSGCDTDGISTPGRGLFYCFAL